MRSEISSLRSVRISNSKLRSVVTPARTAIGVLTGSRLSPSAVPLMPTTSSFPTAGTGATPAGALWTYFASFASPIKGAIGFDISWAYKPFASK
jgi:hypothetical protein